MIILKFKSVSKAFVKSKRQNISNLLTSKSFNINNTLICKNLNADNLDDNDYVHSNKYSIIMKNYVIE